MTNHWVDLQNCKTILVEGSNVAENHPMAFKWIRKAQENGAKIIHVDPRYTRTSAAADVYARIRPGTDAAFQNTMINHIIVNKLYDEDYVVTHTNALYLSDEAFDFKDGVFSGYDEEHHKYDTKTWGYQLDAKGKPRVAKSLDDPHCVFSRLKTFVSRYTLEMGERITGIPADQIQQIAETMAKNRPGSILYALGMTQHTTGVQGIRSFTILQLLLGNIGKPGGGVNALRGEPNVQGACDMAVLYNYMPGLPQLADQCRADDLPLRAQERDRRQPVPRQHAQGVLRRRGHQGERLCLWLAAQAQRVQGLRHHADVRGCPRREAEAPLDRRPESRGHRAQPQADVRRRWRSSRRSWSRRSGRPRPRRSGAGPASTRSPSPPR